MNLTYEELELLIEEGRTVEVICNDSPFKGHKGLVISTRGDLHPEYGGPIIVYFPYPEVPSEVFGGTDTEKAQKEVPTAKNYLRCPRAIGFLATDLLAIAPKSPRKEEPEQIITETRPPEITPLLDASLF